MTQEVTLSPLTVLYSVSRMAGDCFATCTAEFTSIVGTQISVEFSVHLTHILGMEQCHTLHLVN